MSDIKVDQPKVMEISIEEETFIHAFVAGYICANGAITPENESGVKEQMNMAMHIYKRMLALDVLTNPVAIEVSEVVSYE
jgi:hypothetical protein